MTTLATVLQKQKTEHILEAPTRSTRPTPDVAQTNPTLNIALENQTNSGNVFAYVTGLALNNNSQLALVQADGQSLYYPQSPSSNGSPLLQNCAIALGGPGSTRTITIPHLAGARLWFSVNSTLTFLLNPGPGLVEPSVSNNSDPNINNYWDFMEFTYDQGQIFANITYVDFVCLPIALTLVNSSGGVQHVSGMPANGLNTVCSGLQAQQARDNAGWGNLIVTHNGQNLRALSPNNGIVINPNLFSGYFDSYVNAVWSKYTNTILTVDTQASWGNVNGEVSNNNLIFSGVGSWFKPAARDIFSCNSGPFSNVAGEIGNISARLCAGFNRTTLLLDTNEPNGENPANYYQNNITNHYARIVHSVNLDRRGYSFPYDDVGPSGGADQTGYVADGSPQLLTVTVGGNNAHTKVRRRRALQFEDAPVQMQKALEWDANEKRALMGDDTQVDIEMGQKLFGRNGAPKSEMAKFALPPSVQRVIDNIMASIPPLPQTSRLRPFLNSVSQLLDFLYTLLVTLLSASVRKFLARAFFFVVLLVLYFLAGRGGPAGYAGQVNSVVDGNITVSEERGVVLNGH